MDALFFKFIILLWMMFCSISQSTYFAVSYSGRLDRMLDHMKLSDASAAYIRKVAVIYASIAWTFLLVNLAFTLYSIFFTGGYMDVFLAPITTHIYLSNLLIPRFVVFLFSVYLQVAWILPHAMSFMLATIFAHQYKALSRSFDKMLAESDERRLSDSDVETLRQRHEEITISVSETDDILMFHNAGAFCCQLVNSIMILYDFVFFRATNDVLIIVMRIMWMVGGLSGLTITTAGGIMINHYVSTNAKSLMPIVYIRYTHVRFSF